MVASTPNQPVPRPSPEMVTALLQTALRVWKRGDQIRARALVRALAKQYPGEPRIWMLLATVAETQTEQQQALEKLIELEQQDVLRWSRSSSSLSAWSEPFAPAPELIPARSLTSAAHRRKPLFVFALIGVGALIGTTFLYWNQVVVRSAMPTLPTPPLPTLAATSFAAGLATTYPLSPEPTILPLQRSPVPPPTSTPQPPSPSAARISATVTPTPRRMLALGEVVRDGQWHAVLLSSQHALLLDGPIGTVVPRGRFILALIAIGNNGAKPARVPQDMFRLVDRHGSHYTPLSGISTTYLDVYGRGLRGDVSLEEDIPAGGGNVSVPLIFDVPVRARGLTLYMGESALGWPIDDGLER